MNETLAVLCVKVWLTLPLRTLENYEKNFVHGRRESQPGPQSPVPPAVCSVQGADGALRQLPFQIICLKPS